jgi:cytoplasmic tRNA 2-thiolation protein 2
MIHSYAAHVIIFQVGEDITILRPLRESLSKEVGLFNKLKSLNCHSNTDLIVAEAGKKLSIEKMTAIFIGELQADLPSTVSIITKTAFKIQPKKSMVVEQLKNCRLCLGYI